MVGVCDGPPWGTCTCGWPLFRDGSCSNGECPDTGLPDGDRYWDDDEDFIDEEAPA